jgi:transcriptional regulator with XRE-family HTH domain
MTPRYGAALQAARKRAGFKTQEALGDQINRSGRSIRNYERSDRPPEYAVQAELERVLGHFWEEGDEVESAVRRSSLAPFRQTKVLAVYQEQLHEQQREAAAS